MTTQHSYVKIENEDVEAKPTLEYSNPEDNSEVPAALPTTCDICSFKEQLRPKLLLLFLRDMGITEPSIRANILNPPHTSMSDADSGDWFTTSRRTPYDAYSSLSSCSNLCVFIAPNLCEITDVE